MVPPIDAPEAFLSHDLNKMSLPINFRDGTNVFKISSVAFFVKNRGDKSLKDRTILDVSRGPFYSNQKIAISIQLGL